jgi:hypothetical protein
MARSLEAALIVPIALVTWLGMMASAAPCYADMRQTARFEVRAMLARIGASHLYQASSLPVQGHQVIILQTSPQAAIEIRSLIADGWGFIYPDGRSGSGGMAWNGEEVWHETR